MCYSRESFCSCCKSFIRILTINYCLKSNICKASVFPKLIETCSDCLDKLCRSQCPVKLIIPKKWFQTNNIYIDGFGVIGNKLCIFMEIESNLNTTFSMYNATLMNPEFFPFRKIATYFMLAYSFA